MGINAGRNETETRVDLIDPKLSLVGWSNVEGSIVRREYSITQGRIMGGGKRAAVLSADYVLEYLGRKLAVVEAKRESQATPKACAKPPTTPSVCSAASPTPPMAMIFTRWTCSLASSVWWMNS